MKTSLKRKVSNALVTGACAGLGALHFVAQTTADVVSEAEAQLLQRRDGSDIEDIKKERMVKTVDRQQHILDKATQIRQTIIAARNRLRGSNKYEDGTMLPMVLVSVEQVQ